MQAHKNVHPRSSRYADIDTGSYRMMTAEHLRVLDACEQRILLIDTPFDRHVHEARVPFDQINYFTDFFEHYADVLPEIQAGETRLVFMFSDAWNTVNQLETHEEYSGNLLALDLYNICRRACQQAGVLDNSVFCVPTSTRGVVQHEDWPIVYYNEPFNRYFALPRHPVRMDYWEKHFFWLNRRTRRHRLYAIHQAYCAGIFDSAVWTFHDYDEVGNDRAWYAKELAVYGITEPNYGFEQLRTTANHLGEYNVQADVQHQQELANLKTWADTCAVEIVSEYMGSDKKVFLTEKIARSIVMGKPFIVLGDRGMLAELRSLGFATFSDFWDESYDEFPTIQPRIDRALEVAVDYMRTKDLSSGYSDLMIKQLEHNQQHYYGAYQAQQIANFARAVQ